MEQVADDKVLENAGGGKIVATGATRTDPDALLKRLVPDDGPDELDGDEETATDDDEGDDEGDDLGLDDVSGAGEGDDLGGEDDAGAGAASADDKTKPTREKLLAVLARDGVPKKVRESLNDDDLAAWATPRLKAQADSDRMSTELGDLRKKAAGKGSGDKPAEPTGQPAGEGDPDPLAQIEQALGADVAAPLRRVVSSLSDRTAAAERRSLIAEGTALALTAEAPLRAVYGPKAPPPNAVLDKMNEIATALQKQGKVASFDKIAAKAYALLAGERPKADNRASSQPSAPSRGGAQRGTDSGRSPQTFNDLYLYFLDRGYDRATATRKANERLGKARA